MTKLLHHIDQMHIRLAEIAKTEQALVKALGDALAQLDRQLLSDVRNLATEHEARREAILSELQALAGSVGMFRVPRQGAPEELQGYAPQAPQRALSPGDWRQATSNIEDEFDFSLNGHGSPH